ncbi:MAG: hypothetical protein MUF49_05900 [Oculatellaceae cyanobacterium Prado106]|jgi:hypothetical protein|nr:hypothetical protein [Oculatellaceae cyanobacterium Prado106]
MQKIQLKTLKFCPTLRGAIAGTPLLPLCQTLKTAIGKQVIALLPDRILVYSRSPFKRGMGELN